MAPAEVAFYEKEVGNLARSYHLWFVKPNDSEFTEVLVNITDKDGGAIIRRSFPKSSQMKL